MERRDRGGHLARFDHRRPVRSAQEGQPRGDVLRATRPVSDLAETALGHTHQPFLRVHPRPGYRLVRRSLLPIVGTAGPAQARRDRRCRQVRSSIRCFSPAGQHLRRRRQHQAGTRRRRPRGLCPTRCGRKIPPRGRLEVPVHAPGRGHREGCPAGQELQQEPEAEVHLELRRTERGPRSGP